MIKTKWYVLTGWLYSGKTKTIEHLSYLGFKTISEVARILIDNVASKGICVNKLRKNEYNFQKKY